MKALFYPCLLLILLLAPPALLADGNKPAPPGIGLALGSGGAGGLAHIAMLQVFDDLSLKPERVVGSSIGAVIGVLYAAGLNADEIRDIFDDFSGSNLDALSQMARPDAKLGLADLLKLDLANGGVLDSSGFLDFIASHIEARDFSDLAIPFEVVATDYWSGEMVVLKEGELFPAIAASMAVPALFSPEARGEQLLVDGGLSNPLPFDLLIGRHDIVVAIDVSGSRKQQDDNHADMVKMLFNTFEIMQQSIIRARMQESRPTIYIRPDTSNIRLLHFNRIETILEQAKPAAEDLKQQLLARLAARK